MGILASRPRPSSLLAAGFLLKDKALSRQAALAALPSPHPQPSTAQPVVPGTGGGTDHGLPSGKKVKSAPPGKTSPPASCCDAPSPQGLGPAAGRSRTAPAAATGPGTVAN